MEQTRAWLLMFASAISAAGSVVGSSVYADEVLNHESITSPEKPSRAVPLDKARLAAVERQRRVIFNNDGDDAWQGNPNLPPIERFLDCRLNHLGNCGIDTVFYCTTQSINSYTHNSKVTEVFTIRQGAFANNRTEALIKQGTDPLKLRLKLVAGTARKSSGRCE